MCRSIQNRWVDEQRGQYWIHIERYWEGEYPNVKAALHTGDVSTLRERTLRAGLPGFTRPTILPMV